MLNFSHGPSIDSQMVDTKFLVTNLYFLVEFTPILCVWDAILSPSMVSHTWETQSTNDKPVFQKKSSCKWGRQECQIFYPYWPHTHERWGTLTARLFCKVWFPTIKHVGVSNFPPQSNLGGAEADCDTAWRLYWGFTTLIKNPQMCHFLLWRQFWSSCVWASNSKMSLFLQTLDSPLHQW